MDLSRKFELIKSSVNSISRHDDEDADVRHAVLEAVKKHIDEEQEAIDMRVKARADAMLAPKEEAPVDAGE